MDGKDALNALQFLVNLGLAAYIVFKKDKREDKKIESELSKEQQKLDIENRKTEAQIRREEEDKYDERRRKDMEEVRRIYGELTARYEERMDEQAAFYQGKIDEQQRHYEDQVASVRQQMEDKETKALERERTCREEVHTLRNQLQAALGVGPSRGKQRTNPPPAQQPQPPPSTNTPSGP